MKKPTTQPLRAKALDAKDLAAASGGRGIRYGYVDCAHCGYSGDAGLYCPGCGGIIDDPNTGNGILPEYNIDPLR